MTDRKRRSLSQPSFIFFLFIFRQPSAGGKGNGPGALPGAAGAARQTNSCGDRPGKGFEEMWYGGTGNGSM